MKVFYSRVSTIEQNSERQLKNLDGFDYVLTDKCSGLIPLFERPQGSQLRNLIDTGKLSHLEIHSIDRLGRNLISTLEVWNELTQKNIVIVCRNPNIRNIDENGNYVDKAHMMSKTEGIHCPCSRKDRIYNFSQHIKSKCHQQWIKTINLNKTNHFMENMDI